MNVRFCLEFSKPLLFSELFWKNVGFTTLSVFDRKYLDLCNSLFSVKIAETFPKLEQNKSRI